MFLQDSHQLRNCCLWTSFSPWKGKGARGKHQSFQILFWPQNRTHFHLMSTVAESNAGEAQVIGSRPLRVPWCIPLHGYKLPNPTQPSVTVLGHRRAGGEQALSDLTLWYLEGVVIQCDHHCHLYTSMAYHVGEGCLGRRPSSWECWPFHPSKPRLWPWLARCSVHPIDFRMISCFFLKGRHQLCNCCLTMHTFQ